MGVYIPKMKMPKNCAECRFKGLKPYLDDDGDIHIGDACMLCGELVDAKVCSSVCPLVEIKPHGRLIDADALIKQMTEEGWADGCGWADALDLALAPTIIESEREDGRT